MLVVNVFALIYALMFKEKETNKMAMAWLIAYGATFALIEPFQTENKAFLIQAAHGRAYAKS